jgi:hypothetical protein
MHPCQGLVRQRRAALARRETVEVVGGLNDLVRLDIRIARGGRNSEA